MIIFSAKAYEIHSLVSCAKATLNNKLFDPFLCLVGDSKLQAVNKNASIKFGSKEDDNSASRYLSEIIITEDQTRESFASEILKSLEKMKDAEMCTVKEQLLSEFLPDDVCPLGAQMFENPSKIYELDSRQSVCQDETIPFFNIDDDSMTDNKPKPELLLMAENATFLSVNQLLESQKMSNLMTAQRQDYLISLCVENDELEQKRPAPQSLAGNPFLDENLVIPICKTLPPFSPLLMLCATEYQQQPHYFKLPTSCPYDNFLKAAGC